MRHGWRGWGPVGNGEGGEASRVSYVGGLSPQRNCVKTRRLNPLVTSPQSRIQRWISQDEFSGTA